MYYSAIGVLAIFFLIAENHDILLKKHEKGSKMPVWKVYRRFLITVLVYYVTDVLWGLLEAKKLAVLLFTDTLIYFVAMAFSVLLWTHFVVTYLNEKNAFASFLMYAGRFIFAAVTIMVTINIFTPMLFSVDENSVYHAYPTRYALLISQIALLILLSVYALFIKTRRTGTVMKRYRTVALFGLIMAFFLSVQLQYPYLPLYTMAYMTGTCLLHSFVVQEEKEEYRAELERTLEREKRQYEELKNTRSLAYRDPLTGVKNKLAYTEIENEINTRISNEDMEPFCIVVCDVNGLKIINDNKGHKAGDDYLCKACMILCRAFQHSPVYRIGGDEFVIVAMGGDYKIRRELLSALNTEVEENLSTGEAVIAAALSDYTADTDKDFHAVFERADGLMYERKKQLKQLGAVTR